MLINDKVDAVFIPDSPSRIKATDYNQIKNEIQECITEAGLTPTKDVIQLPQALKILTAQSGAEEVAKIEAAGQEQTSAINSTGAMQVESINTAGSSQVNKVNDAGNTQKAMLENTGKTQVTAVRSAGTDTVTQVEQAGIDAAQLAKDWANKTDGAVAEGEYSAKKYAQEAAQSASTINPSTYVPKAGGTMTGNLHLQNSQLNLIRTGFSKGDIPTGDTYIGRIDCFDENNTVLFQEYNYITKTSGISSFTKRIWANKAGSTTYKDVIRALVTPEGNAALDLSQNNTVTVQTPAASDNSTKVATTAWVRNLISGQSLVNDYVIDSYSDDDGNWYRVYKSGWVEQGGIVSRMTESEQRKTTLVKPYANNKYSVFLNFKADDDPILCSRTLGLAREITSTYFTIVNYGWSSNYNGVTGYWMACGQGA